MGNGGLDTWINGRYKKFKTSSSIQIKREKRSWETKETMSILKSDRPVA
jgi:hypothetical protein